MATVLLAVHDLFFTAKLEALLRQTGHTPRKGGGDPVAEAADAPPDLLILDLDASHLDPLDLLRRWKGEEATAERPVLAYTNHSNVEGMRRAMELGAEKVVARSEIAVHLPGLVERLAE